MNHHSIAALLTTFAAIILGIVALTTNNWSYYEFNDSKYNVYDYKPIDRIQAIIRTRPLITETQTHAQTNIKVVGQTVQL